MDSLKSITQKRDENRDDYEESLDKIEEDLEDELTPTNSPNNKRQSTTGLDKFSSKKGVIQSLNSKLKNAIL